MRVLKWIGYSLIAVIVLSVLVGVGLFIATVGAFIAGIFLVVFGVGFIAYLIKEAIESPRPTGVRDP
jgi:uncharacterized protein involved in cysteine biosynthesis